MENESNAVNKKNLVIKWGLIGGLAGIIFFIVLDLAGLSGNQNIQWLGFIITITVITLAHNEFKAEGNGYLNYSQGLGIGTLVSLVSAAVSSVFTFIYVSFVNDEIIIKAREKAIMDMENSGQSDAQIEQGMSIVEIMTSPIVFLIMGLVLGVFFGFLISLIVSIFTKKNSTEFV